jgi:c-di-GMP-binding flagellar brake protein YcgR
MERRRSPRVQIEVWVEEESAGEVYHLGAADLSLGGMRFRNVVPRPAGTVLVLKFTLPDGNPRPLRVRGRVVNPRAEETDFGMSIEFVSLGPVPAQRIARFVASRVKAAGTPP